MPRDNFDELLRTLQQRFEQHMHRHPDAQWSTVVKLLKASPASLRALIAMERTGGEPDLIEEGTSGDSLVFYDCAVESPAGRRSLCYDGAALDARKANKPAGSAMQLALDMGVDMLTEAQYRALQERFAFDLKTSSWIATPDAIRTRGGALFCDRRFDHVFTYHNGAESYYASRAFRARLVV